MVILKAWPNARNVSTQHLATLLHDVAACVEWTGQTHATYRNRVAKRTQHVVPNNVEKCCVEMLRAFGQAFMMFLKARANARNIVGQQDATLLGPTCCERLHTMLCVVACCCDLLEVVGGSLKLVKLQSQQVPTFLLFRGHRSVVQQCCVRLHSTSNNVAPAHAHYMPRIHTNTCEQEINMTPEMVNVPESFVFSSKDPTCCDLLRAFAHIGSHRATRENIVGPNNVACCCERLHGP